MENKSRRLLQPAVGPAAQIILTSVPKSMECGIWLLIIMALPVFSTDQLSPAGTDSSQICTRLCRRNFVLHKYLLFISDIGEQLAYKWHLSTYPPSNCDRWYYSKWSQFVSPHATWPTYISLDSKCHEICENQPFLWVVFAV